MQKFQNESQFHFGIRRVFSRELIVSSYIVVFVFTSSDRIRKPIEKGIVKWSVPTQ